MEHSEYLHLRYLLSVDGLGPVKIRSLYSRFNGFENVFAASVTELMETDGIHKNLAKKILSFRSEFESTEQKISNELEQLQKIGAELIPFSDERYPASLKNIYDPPLIIYTLGNLDRLTANPVAIVGTRHPTQYGRQICNRLAKELTEAGITIISGLARGIDTIAHTACLNNGGTTYAVLGTGLDIVYPAENKKLSSDIAATGALITEFPLGTKPDGGNFPRRNRIISGLSKIIIVVETGLTGGAMITANLAADQGRDVYAVPGNLGSHQSDGTNQLIKVGGAKLFNRVDDILEDLGLGKDKRKARVDIKELAASMNLFEQKIYNLLGTEPLSIDKISSLSELSVSDCLVNLLTLEFKGLVRQLPGKMFTAE